MQILHVSADFPDPFDGTKTRAVSNLLNLTPEHDHQVYSVNRVNGLSGHAALSFGPSHRAVAYGAPPKGFWLTSRLEALAQWIAEDARARGLSPDVIHAHKLSVEGLAGQRIAQSFGTPLIVSAQGNSDLRIIGARPDLRARWRAIWQSASVLLPFAPWTSVGLKEMLGPRNAPMDCLPCPTLADKVIAPRITPPRVLSVFGLDDHVNKNAALLISAVKLLRDQGTAAELDIVGSGSAQSFAQISGMVSATPGIRLLGPIRNDRLQSLMNRSAVLAVPSKRESYGMVFAEALLAGCPVLHGHENGIAGYFSRVPWAASAPKSGTEALARTLRVMLKAQQQIKAALATAQRSGALDVLRRPAIAERYRLALAQAHGRAPADQSRAA